MCLINELLKYNLLISGGLFSYCGIKWILNNLEHFCLTFLKTSKGIKIQLRSDLLVLECLGNVCRTLQLQEEFYVELRDCFPKPISKGWFQIDREQTHGLLWHCMTKDLMTRTSEARRQGGRLGWWSQRELTLLRKGRKSKAEKDRNISVTVM